MIKFFERRFDTVVDTVVAMLVRLWDVFSDLIHDELPEKFFNPDHRTDYRKALDAQAEEDA